MSAPTSFGQAVFQGLYEISPIFLTGGLAGFLPGSTLPLTAITELLDISGLESKEFFAHYRPLPNSTLIDFSVAEYPFANMEVAANAVVQNPLKISMLMVCPAQNYFGYPLKLALMTLLQTQLQAHINAGGSFTVLTPAYVYTNCLLTNIRDVSSPTSKQVQEMYQLDFVQPLLTESAASSVLGNLMNKVNNGLPAIPQWSGVSTSVGGFPT